MRKRQAGQAFILVLILLAVGALLIAPALRLTSTALKSSQVVTRQTKALYAADAAQEYVLWKLLWTNYADTFTYDGQSDNFTFDACGVSVNVTVIMRATVGAGGINLSTDDLIRPTKTVSPDTDPPNGSPITYIINLEQLSDNTTQGLDAIYDILPKGLNYIPNSSQLRVDGGAWEDIPEPSYVTQGNQVRLRWPEEPGAFSSDNGSPNYFNGMRDFTVRQVKELRFQVTGSLLNNKTYYNWVLLKLGDIVTLSGPQAPIITGDGSNPEGGLLAVDKVSDPPVILPGVEPIPVEYTIAITNLTDSTLQLQEIRDYLPLGFSYTANSTSGITNFNPQPSLENINGVDRWKLLWTTAEFPNGNAVSIASGEILYLTFSALTTPEVSGTYYNEVMVLPNTTVPGIFKPDDMNVTDEDFLTNYSWNTEAGAVVIPAYDSRAEADGVIIDANMELLLGGISIKSWQVD